MKILLGMSGGLDSTYAAKKLMDMGHDVEGAVLVMHEYTEVDAATSAAESLGLKLHILDCREAFKSKVVENFISEYKNARTPNPCVICNSEIKFKCLYEYAVNNGFDKIATGHYAEIAEYMSGAELRYRIARARDEKKDQTYVLWRLSQSILSKLILPLSSDEKARVRESAKKEGLIAADRADSQEICFIPDGNHADFIEKHSSPTPCGNFVDENGKILGEHKGIIRYTVGQRKGLGIAMGKRIFVTDINADDNTVTLSFNDKMSSSVKISGMVFSGISEPKTGESLTLSVKLRYLAPLVKCSLIYEGDGRGMILLNEPVRAVTPGQSAVLYYGDFVAAGGFIDSAF